MAFWDGITKLFRRDPPTENTSFDGRQATWSKTVDPIENFKVEQDRFNKIKESNELYDSDDLAKGIIRTLAANATMGGFTFSSKDKRVQDEVNALIKRTKMQRLSFGYLRKGITDGDLFIQVVVDSNRDIVKLKKMPAMLMRRNSNDADEFDDPAKAYYQVDPMTAAFFSMDPKTLGDSVTWFADWQIIHLRYDFVDGDRYGTPIINSHRGTFKKIREGALDMSIRRKTRAGLKFIHSLEDASDVEVEAYKNRNQQALSNPFAAIADFFSTKRTSIQAIQGDANLNQIKDIMFHVDKLFSGTPVPKSLLGFEQSVNRDVLEKQEVQFLRELDTIEDFITEFIEEVVNLQLLLKGILPESVDYTISWADRWGDQKMKTLTTISDVLGKIKLLDLIPEEELLKILLKYMPDIDPKIALKYIKDRQEEQQAMRDSFANRQNNPNNSGNGPNDGSIEAMIDAELRTILG